MKVAPRMRALGVALLTLSAVISLAAPNRAAAAVEDAPDDDALRSHLGQSELVVDGEMLFGNPGGFEPEPFKVASTIKGEPRTDVRIWSERGWPGPNMEYPDGEMVLFLYRRAQRGSTNLEPFWRPRDLKFGAMPATPAL